MSVPFDTLTQFGSAFGQALISGLWVGCAVALAVGLFVKLHRGLNAASRHAAWYAALVVIAIIPIVSIGVSLSRMQVVTVPAQRPAPVMGHAAVAPSVSVAKSGPALAAEHTAPATTGLHSVTSSARSALSPAVVEQVALVIGALVALIALARIIVLLTGLWGLARVKRASRIVDPSLSPTLARTIAHDAGARAVHVRVSDSIEAPAAAGFRSPAILLPVDLVEELDRESLDQIAMHEYAHLRRYDDWTNLFQRFIERLYWFNPAVWFVGSRIDLEREIACDDWAVAGADGVTRYADCLWRLAVDGRVPSFAATAPGAFLTRNQISARIEHLLERHRDGAPTLRAARLWAIAPALVAAVALVAGRAPAIALHVTAPAAPLHAVVGIRMIPAPTKTVSGAQVATTIAAAATPCPHATHRAHLGAGATTAYVTQRAHLGAVHAQIDKALAAHSSAPNTIAEAVVSRVATSVAVQTSIHLEQRIIEHKVHAAAPLIADATETDNLSYGPNDRNLLAHCTGCDLSNRDLRNVDLHGLTLTGDDLSGADLRGANLRGSVLTGVDLSDAKLDGADLRGASLTGTDIDGATFTNAKTDGIRLAGMQLTNSILSVTSARAILSACAGCDLTGLDLRGRDLHGVTFDGADLHGADFSNANLQGARFNGVDLSGVRFAGADLRHAEFNGCDLRNVNLDNAKTDGMQLEGSQLGSDSGT